MADAKPEILLSELPEDGNAIPTAQLVFCVSNCPTTPMAMIATKFVFVYY